MPRKIGYTFRILDSANNVTTTSVDMGDMFVEKDAFLNSGLWSWGANYSVRAKGMLGLGDITDRSSPVFVGTLTNWKQIDSAMGYTLAIKTDGTLWAWGSPDLNFGPSDFNGQLGLGDVTSRSSPVQVGSLTNWKQVSCFSYHSAAIKTDGTLWTWGLNSSGPLGLGDITDRSSPVQVGSLTNWKQVSCGYDGIFATKTDGTLWTWGNNTNGQLGLGDLTSRSSPVQVGSLTNWKQVSYGNQHTVAIKTDGTLWTWGNNPSGQLGLSDQVHRSSPVQVGSLTNWKQVVTGAASAAIKTDGTLWTWGSNSYGALGLGDQVHRSSPVQVGSLTNWKLINMSIFLSHTAAIKTDGTLWTWGLNTNGQLGLGDINRRSSPVQVGSLTNWKQISTGMPGFGGGFSIAIVSDDFYTYT